MTIFINLAFKTDLNVEPTDESSFKDKLNKNTYPSTSPMNQNAVSGLHAGAVKESTGLPPHLPASQAQVLVIILKELLPSVPLTLTQRGTNNDASEPQVKENLSSFTHSTRVYRESVSGRHCAGGWGGSHHAAPF